MRTFEDKNQNSLIKNAAEGFGGQNSLAEPIFSPTNNSSTAKNGKSNANASAFNLGINPIQMHPGHAPAPANAPEQAQPAVIGPENNQAAAPVNAPQNAIGPVPENVEADIAAFKSRIYGPQNVSTPIGGRFNASFYPNSKITYIDLTMGVDFLDPLSIDGSGVVTINSTGDATEDAKFTQARVAAMAVPLAQRAAFVANYQWNAADKTSKLADLTARNTEAEAIWSNQHTFYVNKPGWENVTSSVSVNITEHETSTNADQLKNRIFKTPPGLNIGAWVNMAGNANQQGMMTLDDNEVAAPTGGGLLQWKVQFGNNSSVLNAASKSMLNKFAITFSDDAKTNKGDGNAANDAVDNGVMNKVKLIGHSSSSGDSEKNQILAQKRSQAVKDYLIARGFHGITENRVEMESKGDEGATDDPAFRRVDLIVGDGKAQNVVAHELGHVFGLDDEYATQNGSLIRGTGNPTGTQVGHDGLATGIGAPNATAENNDGIMSLGNNVRAQHYSTFGNALQQITNVPEWQILT